ncbi:MAG: YncE family protein, partial [Kofleriaceae bacterium]
MLKTSFPFLLACSLVACGDDGNSTPDAPDGETAQPRAVVVAGTFMAGTAGVMSKLELDTLAVEQRVAPTAAVGSDPMLRKFGDELFVVNRADGNNVTILDARTFAVVEQLATGANSNAQDVAVVGDQLFVPAFGTAGVVVLTRGTTQISTIDLSALDPDGKPDCVSAYAVGNQVFVACEMLDQTFIPRGPGKVAVIDASTHALLHMLTLTYPNPFGVFEQLPAELGGQLVIPTVPSFADATMGCVEQIS